MRISLRTTTSVQADVASFFVSVRRDELERRLLEAGSNPSVVRDLHALLTGWHAEGVQGLPQGLLPSSVLGNFYLASVDRALRARGTRFWRYMDDIAVAADGFHAGRQVLDALEDELYTDGLTLGALKTKVIRATSADDEFQTMRERFNEQFEEFLGELGDYAPGDNEASFGESRFEAFSTTPSKRFIVTSSDAANSRLLCKSWVVHRMVTRFPSFPTSCSGFRG
jgi:hypothetical protein